MTQTPNAVAACTPFAWPLTPPFAAHSIDRAAAAEFMREAKLHRWSIVKAWEAFRLRYIEMECPPHWIEEQREPFYELWLEVNCPKARVKLSQS